MVMLMRATHQALLDELLSLPTSPFNEQHITAFIRRWAAGRFGLRLSADEFGNLRLHLRRGRRHDARPLVFSAHMDHPGFEAERMIGPRRLRAIWRGGVAPEFFVGSRVRFFVDGRWVSGVIRSTRVTVDRGRKRVASAMVSVAQAIPSGAIGMWDLPDPRIREHRIFARGCDDVAGLAAVLAAFDELARGRGPVEVYALFTRAEEVGFAGAIAACRSGLIPRDARIVAVECSSVLPGVLMGGGPILRVGDRSAIFSPGLTTWCGRVAEELAGREPRFRFQRKLMDGGTCESAAFRELGYEATGLCIALGNYHNMDRSRRRIAAEFVDLRDFDALVRWFVELAVSKLPFDDRDPVLRRVLGDLERRWTPLLRRTAGRMKGADPPQHNARRPRH